MLVRGRARRRPGSTARTCRNRAPRTSSRPASRPPRSRPSRRPRPLRTLGGTRRDRDTRWRCRRTGRRRPDRPTSSRATPRRRRRPTYPRSIPTRAASHRHGRRAPRHVHPGGSRSVRRGRAIRGGRSRRPRVGPDGAPRVWRLATVPHGRRGDRRPGRTPVARPCRRARGRRSSPLASVRKKSLTAFVSWSRSISWCCLIVTAVCAATADNAVSAPGTAADTETTNSPSCSSPASSGGEHSERRSTVAPQGLGEEARALRLSGSPLAERVEPQRPGVDVAVVRVAGDRPPGA